MGLLQEAADFAKESACSAWEFAVDIASLRQAGLTDSQIRLLVVRGLVEQRQEQARPRAKHRQFLKVANLMFQDKTCFVLTPLGQRVARQSLSAQATTRTPAAKSLPRWDAQLRELWWGHILLKRFEKPAPFQEALLAAFQENRWIACLVDPLPSIPGQNRKQKLRYTIKHLNRSLQRQVLRFRGDGTGRGVRWERREVAPHMRPKAPRNPP